MRKAVKLGQYISSQSAYSRRKILDLLKDGRIKVNGEVVSQMAQMVTPGKDTISVEGKVVELIVSTLYYKYYKPRDLITTLEDPRGRPCIGDIVKEIDRSKSLVPVGRLDRQTTGLLFLSNDGDFTNKICHPSFKLPKLYRVTLDKTLTKADFIKLTTGFFLEDGPVQFSKVVFPSSKAVDVTLSEGRNRIVRRAFEFLGYTVKKLKRLSVGPVGLGDLKEGHWVPMTKKEVNSLLL
jgi:23S rRNA pseudouridine2605 synthase